jgi:hypothetical protein
VLLCLKKEWGNRVNYYESVVVDYLRADRSLFVNTECCIQLNEADNPDKSGPHWYCDALAVDFRSKSIFLCEFSYSVALQALIKRLKAWNENWQGVCHALVRDSHLPAKEWTVRPWLFIPEESVKVLQRGLEKIAGNRELSFKSRITTLEMVQPWKYSSYNRKGEEQKPDGIPQEMQH